MSPPLDRSPIGAVALLDACVLVQMAAREALLAFAQAGLYAPRWSARIEGEWRATAMKPGRALEAASIDGDIALAHLRAPGAMLADEAALEAIEAGLSLPDWNDRHVLAAAIQAEATILVTDNLKDFPRRRLAGHGLVPVAADAFLAALVDFAQPGAETEAIRTALDALRASAAEPISRDDLPARLKRARLPRFAKAVARFYAAG